MIFYNFSPRKIKKKDYEVSNDNRNPDLNGNGTTQPVKKIYEQKLNQTFQ